MASLYTSSSADKDPTAIANSTRASRSLTLIPTNSDEPSRVFHSLQGPFSVGRNGSSSSGAIAKPLGDNAYTTNCPVVSRNHAQIRWLSSGDIVIVDNGSHHGTYINDSLTKLTPGHTYKLNDHDTVSFGKGIFKDGRFHAPHAVVIRLGEIESPKPKSRSGTFGLKSYGSETARLETAASQSEVAEKQADRIRTEVQRLGRKKDVAVRQKRQLQDVSSRLEWLEKNAVEKNTPSNEIELRLRALEQHYEGLLEKLTVIEKCLRTPEQGEGGDVDQHKHHGDDDGGDETDDDEPTPAKRSSTSLAGTIAMAVVGGVVVWTALALT